MDSFKERFRGRVIPIEEDIKEVPREEGLRIEERRIREKLEGPKKLSKEEIGRLENRLEQIFRERNPKNDLPKLRSSIVKP